MDRNCRESRREEENETRKIETEWRKIEERKCFGCGEWGHIIMNCRTKERKKVAMQQSSNIFEVLKSRVMNIEEGSGREIRKDRKTILREKKEKNNRSKEDNRRRRSIEKSNCKD